MSFVTQPELSSGGQTLASLQTQRQFYSVESTTYFIKEHQWKGQRRVTYSKFIDLFHAFSPHPLAVSAGETNLEILMTLEVSHGLSQFTNLLSCMCEPERRRVTRPLFYHSSNPTNLRKEGCSFIISPLIWYGSDWEELAVQYHLPILQLWIFRFWNYEILSIASVVSGIQSAISAVPLCDRPGLTRTSRFTMGSDTSLWGSDHNTDKFSTSTYHITVPDIDGGEMQKALLNIVLTWPYP